MNLCYLQALSLTLCVFGMSQTHAAALQNPAKSLQNSSVAEKSLTPIERALTQQKRERAENKHSSEMDQIKVITSIKNAPTQNFLASQHQQFSRFLQSLFPQHTS